MADNFAPIINVIELKVKPPGKIILVDANLYILPYFMR